MRRFIGVFAVLGTVATAPAAAQEVCQALVTPPPVGSWAEYRFQGQGQEALSRMAVVAEESRGGQTLTRYEMSFDGNGQRVVVQLLAQGGIYTAMADHTIEEIVVKAGAQPAMKFSGAMVERMQEQMDMGSDPATQFGQGCATAERVGSETVTVPAGTFEAVRYRLATGANPGDAWIVPDLPFAMVKWAGDRGESVVLTGRGDDATPSITGTPLEVPGG